jgi:hypothetical protein
MDPKAVQRMIHQLITPEEVERAPEATASDFDPRNADADTDAMAIEQIDSEDVSLTSDVGKNHRSAARRVTAEAEAEGKIIGEALAPPTEGLRIGEAELDYMDEVAALMPRTPRSVKRFVNIYRLYKAALSTPALGNFVGTPDRPGNFRAVQVLLALVTGTPSFAKAVIGALEETASPELRRLSDLIGYFEAEDESWQTTIDALAEFAVDENDLKLDELREVSPLVCRYSVHHLVSRVAGESTLG